MNPQLLQALMQMLATQAPPLRPQAPMATQQAPVGSAMGSAPQRPFAMPGLVGSAPPQAAAQIGLPDIGQQILMSTALGRSRRSQPAPQGQPAQPPGVSQAQPTPTSQDPVEEAAKNTGLAGAGFLASLLSSPAAGMVMQLLLSSLIGPKQQPAPAQVYPAPR